MLLFKTFSQAIYSKEKKEEEEEKITLFFHVWRKNNIFIYSDGGSNNGK